MTITKIGALGILYPFFCVLIFTILNFSFNSLIAVSRICITAKILKEVFMKKYITPSIKVVSYEMFDILTGSNVNFNVGWINPLKLG